MLKTAIFPCLILAAKLICIVADTETAKFWLKLRII